MTSILVRFAQMRQPAPINSSDHTQHPCRNRALVARDWPCTLPLIAPVGARTLLLLPLATANNICINCNIAFCTAY